MGHNVSGVCHCRNLSYELTTEVAPGRIQARACDCRFCRMHGARNWSDPQGSAVVRVKDEACLQKYRFSLKTADYYVCRICGAYLGAVLCDEEGCWSTVNLRLSEMNVHEEPVHYGGEDQHSRIARRKRKWTPTTIVVTDAG